MYLRKHFLHAIRDVMNVNTCVWAKYIEFFKVCIVSVSVHLDDTPSDVYCKV